MMVVAMRLWQLNDGGGNDDDSGNEMTMVAMRWWH